MTGNEPDLSTFPSLESLKEVVQMLREVLSIYSENLPIERRKWLIKSINIIEEEIQTRRDFEAWLHARIDDLEKNCLNWIPANYIKIMVFNEILGEDQNE